MPNVPMSANGMVRDLVGAVAMGCPWDKIGQNVRGFVTYDLNYALRTGIVLKAGELLKAYSVDLCGLGMPGSSDRILGFGGQTANLIEANEAKEEQRRGIDDARTAATAKAGSNRSKHDDI